jgi:hypothetical protein
VHNGSWERLETVLENLKKKAEVNSLTWEMMSYIIEKM